MKKKDLIQFIDGDLRLDVTVTPNEETVWLTQDQMALLFNVDRSGIARHINNILKSGELEETTSVQILHESKNPKNRPPKYYNLDMIISVGYKVNSKRGVLFRKWATNILKKYMIEGYAINEKRLAQLQRTVEVQMGLISGISEMAGFESLDILNVINQYTDALDLLDDYDHQRITKPKGREVIAYLSEEDCRVLIEKTKFSKQSDLFGKERDEGMLRGILNQIKQNVFGVELYPSLEEKAANLLYMLVKDHIYYDGNKRLASIIFLEFLNRNHALYHKNHTKVLSNAALVAITLLIAISNPIEKEVMVNIVMNLLKEK